MPRSRYVLTPEDQVRVRELAAIGMPEEEIAFELRLPQPKLRKIFERELKSGAARGREQVLATLHAAAVSGQNLNVSTFWVKSRCGWRDTGSAPSTEKVVNKLFIYPENAPPDWHPDLVQPN